ncbi:MAG: hypothetical protein HS113_00060 [Verrucomicrobiales bacterium]|nr:hypothetical protein [Verrucomicrobiales bacterium]
MSEPFIPFSRTRATPRGARQTFRLAVLPQGAPPAAPTAPTLPNTPSAPPAPTVPPPEPQLTLERDGDRITRITLRCPCGAIHELVCTS